MKYFCRVRLEAGKDQEAVLFLVFEDETETPQLDKRTLIEHHEYRRFSRNHRTRIIIAEYAVYSTEENVTANLENSRFEALIEDGKAELAGSGELQIDRREKQNKKTGRIEKKHRPSLRKMFALSGGALTVGFFCFLIGRQFGTADQLPVVQTEENGLMIPQPEQDENAEQITVTIDRSYLAVPTEDLQIKGAVINGKAAILLPDFDQTDYFSHVQGYSFGYSSDPNGKKIEYYGGQEYPFSADTKLYRVLVKYAGGSGTKEDPYLLNYYDQLELMSKEAQRGYFRQIADISFPNGTSHTPIRTVNTLKADPQSEYFEYDGGGFSISNLDAPLFETVSGAVIKNVHIRDSEIISADYKDYGLLVCNAVNYHYLADDEQVYETGETVIQHCSVSHSSVAVQLSKAETPAVTTNTVVPPHLIEYDENGNLIEKTEEPDEPSKTGAHCIGAISGIGGQIEDCYVTDFGIYAELDDYYLYCGGISGKPASVRDSAVYYYSAQGNLFYAGGIVGSAAGARAFDAMGRELPDCYGGFIQGCAARKIILKPETAAGGIVGEGTTDSDSAVISNCYAADLRISCGMFQDAERTEMKKEGAVGGMIGTDGIGANGHILINCVSPANCAVIGQQTGSVLDETVWQAPDSAFHLESILTVLNGNSVNPVHPNEIYTGRFLFGENGEFADESGSFAYPESIRELLDIKKTES